MKKYRLLIQILVCLFPLLPLFYLKNVFNYDWDNHLFMIRYHGEYFKTHHTFPNVFNFPGFVGYANPLFYGTFFFPLLGFFSCFFGADLALRFCVFVVLLGQFTCIRRLFLKTGEPFSFLVATLFTWSIYPLTNLYNRCALPEFFAVCFFTMGSCLWLQLASCKDLINKKIGIITCVLLFSLTLCTHPITGFYGGCIALVNGLLSFRFSPNKKGLLIVAMGCILLAGIICSPFIYVSLLHHSHLLISQTTQRLHYFKYIDAWYTRLMPFPFDYRSMENGISLETPYLDAQICLPLLVILVSYFFKIKSRKTFFRNSYFASFIFNLFCLILFFYISIHLHVNSWYFIPKIFFSLQFHYRLISYINLFTLLVLYFLVKITASKIEPVLASLKPVITVCITLSFLGVVLKIPHALAVMKSSSMITNPITPPESFPYVDYIDSFHFQRSQEGGLKVGFITDSASRFGLVNSIVLESQKPRMVDTNVTAFPWNTVTVNDEILKNEALFVGPSNTISLLVPEGESKLSYLFNPSSAWSFLHTLSWIVFCGGIFVLLFLLLTKKQGHFL